MAQKNQHVGSSVKLKPYKDSGFKGKDAFPPFFFQLTTSGAIVTFSTEKRDFV